MNFTDLINEYGADCQWDNYCPHRQDKPAHEQKPEKHTPSCCCDDCRQCNCCHTEDKPQKPVCKEEINCILPSWYNRCNKEKRCDDEGFDRRYWDDWNDFDHCECKEEKNCICRLFKCKF